MAGFTTKVQGHGGNIYWRKTAETEVRNEHDESSLAFFTFRTYQHFRPLWLRLIQRITVHIQVSWTP